MEIRPCDRRRLLDKLVREVVHAEAQAVDHAPREARRIGEAPPVLVLREVGDHAIAMQRRLLLALAGHDLLPDEHRLSSTFSTLRQLVADKVYAPERAFRGALLDLRHGVDVVRVLRDVARGDGLFAVIRWCDDWLIARRTLVARVEAQLAWFAEPATPTSTPEPVAHGSQNIESGHDQERNTHPLNRT